MKSEIVKLYCNDLNGFAWDGGEREFYSEAWQGTLVGNISQPSLLIYKPAESRSNGKAVIVAPGGALYYNSIETEGKSVAECLTKQGYLVAILKYRLVPTKNNSLVDLTLDSEDKQTFFKNIYQILPHSLSDAVEGMLFLKKNHETLKLDKEKIGFMGFSAGGAIAMALAYTYNSQCRPNFLVTVYPWTEIIPVKKPQEDAPPLLVICASDDELDLAPGAVSLYNAWRNNGFCCELHMYAEGSHGFGMKRKSGKPHEKWIERFIEWNMQIE